MLLKHGADVHTRDTNGLTPMHTAVRKIFCEIAPDVPGVLLQAGGELQAITNQGDTLRDLVPAEFSENTLMARFFKRHGL